MYIKLLFLLLRVNFLDLIRVIVIDLEKLLIPKHNEFQKITTQLTINQEPNYLK